MSKKQSTGILLISVISLCLSAFSLFTVLRLPAEETRDIQYVMYLGTNDKDTNQPVFSPDNAKSHADSILTKYFTGFTVQEAIGGWTGDNGVVAHEYTLVIYLSDTSIEKVHAAADALIQEFHQSSVLIQANATKTEFYSGKTESK
ncbi:MAG: DUF3574 domain-containing protein [Fretibacterium sp.]|nr:DUF3574 domain-containing protein [Fretibacterium sp.]